jgi:hypothetical protein
MNRGPFGAFMTAYSRSGLWQPMNIGRLALLFVPSITAIVAASGLAVAAPQANQRTWALLIGVQDYDDPALDLRYSRNDVESLAEVLVTRGFEYEQALTKLLIDPTKEQLLNQIASFLNPISGEEGPQEQDQILLYFTAHGFHGPAAGDNSADLYLAPKDFKRMDPAGTGINVEDLRTLVEKCPARSKVVIIDSCYAGNQQSPAAASDIEKSFDGLAGTVTLASSSKDEESIEWDKVKHSLFTYWLIQALSGHADTSMDGEVTFDEVYSFVHKKVSTTAFTQFGAEQTPVASMRFSSEGFPTLMRLKPQPLNRVLSDMAQQIVRTVEDETLNQIVSIPPFLYTSYDDITDLDADKDPERTTLGLDCAQRFHDFLDASGDVKVRKLEDVRRVLKTIRATTRDIGTFQGMQRIAKYHNRDIPPVVVYGELLERRPGIVEVRARAIRNDTKATLIETGGTAELTTNEWLETNKSVIAQTADFRRMLDPESGTYKTRGISAIEKWHERERSAPHPNQELSFPFHVEILVRRKPTTADRREWIVAQCEYIGNEAYVALDKGQEYRIRVTYRDLGREGSRDSVFMKLLVDGLNIRAQQRPAGVSDYEIKTRGVAVLEQNPVPLHEADTPPERQHVWIMRPAESAAVAERAWVFEGFYLSDEFVCPFIVGEASESRGLADEIGTISAVFYHEDKTRGGVGTIAGVPRQAERPVQRIPAGHVCNLIGSIQIKYVSARELEQLKGR